MDYNLFKLYVTFKALFSLSVFNLYNNCFILDHDQFFDGRVFGELNSDASIHLEDGVITGTIQFSDETYHIEVCLYNDIIIICKKVL